MEKDFGRVEEHLITPVYGEYDIVVVGAGPAGVSAALAAGRAGAKVLIMDRFNCMGGAWTTGFMNPLFDHRNKDGILRELINDLSARGQWGGFWDESFHYETMKVLLEEKLRDAGVTMLFNTTFSRTLVEEAPNEAGRRVVTGVIAENASGRYAYKAKLVFDCTGDGNAAADAGCAYEIGVDGDYRECQAMTLMFLVGNIPPQYRAGMKLKDKLEAVYEKAGREIPFHMPYLIPVPSGQFAVIQFTHMYEYDPLSAEEVTQATIEGRRQMMEAVELLRTYDEEFRDLELITSSGVLGIRESRRIVGEYTLTLEDVQSGKQFEDGIADVTFGIDIHPKYNNAQKLMKSRPYQIPFRCLIPRGWDGILTAGRCISGTHEAMASYRVTGNCSQMGERAGRIAVYALRAGVNVREVDVREALAAPT